MPNDHLTKRPLSQKRITKLRTEFRRKAKPRPKSRPKPRSKSRTKEEKFIKLAKNRYVRASKQISLLKNLTAHAYEMNSEIAHKVLGDLEKEMAGLRCLWEGRLAGICGSSKCKAKLPRPKGQGRPRKFCKNCRPSHSKEIQEEGIDEVLRLLRSLLSKKRK